MSAKPSANHLRTFAKVVWAGINVAIIAAFVLPGSWAWLVPQSGLSSTGDPSVDTIGNVLWLVLLAGLIIYFISWAALAVGVVDLVVLLRRLRRLGTTRWRGWLYNVVLAGGVATAVYATIKILINQPGIAA